MGLRTPVRRRRGRLLAALVVAAATAIPAGRGLAREVPPFPIPEDGTPAPSFIGKAAKPRSVKSFDVPRHPFMAANGRSNIHNDAYMTDAYRWPGPLGRRMKVSSTFMSAECGSTAFDSAGRIVTICVGLEGPRLVLMRSDTLETLAVMQLPTRSTSGTGTHPFNDFAAGGYFYLDHKDRSVIPTTTRQVWIVAHEKLDNGNFAFEVERVFNLAPDVLPNEGIVSILPDWRGLIWFVTTRGLVGTVDPQSGSLESQRLEDEVIANSFAVDEHNGVFIVTDRALYRFEAEKSGQPKISWREKYDRGDRVKPGQVSQGSGTTPTVIGDDFVAITDNADPRMHVVVYRRAERVKGRRLVCSEPVFGKNRGATDNSLIAAGHSLIVENNYGYSDPRATMDGQSTAPGLTRVDFKPSGKCRTTWTSEERAPSVVPKLSLETGLVYTYTKSPRKDGEDPWYLTAVSFRTGRTVYKRLAGEGLGYNNNYAPITLGPDGRAYVGALGGLVQLTDANG